MEKYSSVFYDTLLANYIEHFRLRSQEYRWRNSGNKHLLFSHATTHVATLTASFLGKDSSEDEEDGGGYAQFENTKWGEKMFWTTEF